MDTATTASLLLGGIGTAAGTAALFQQWQERRRRLRVSAELGWTYTSSAQRRQDFIHVVVSNPTLVPLKMKLIGVTISGNATATPMVASGLGFPLYSLGAFHPATENRQYPCLIGARDAQEAAMSVEEFKALSNATDPVRLRPFCIDVLGRQYVGHPIDVYLATLDFTKPRRRLYAPWSWGKAQPVPDTHA